MAKKTTTQLDKLFNLLVKRRNGVTTKVAQSRGINRVSARVYELRSEGFRIYSNRKGRIVSYQLDLDEARRS